MIQYHPTTVELGEKRMLLSEAARGEGGRLFALRNGKPWYFMEEKYLELGNLMPRDVTAREIWYHCQAGETVWLDLTGLEEDIFFRKLSGLVADCLLYGGVDIRCQPIAVAPGIHYFMGGLYVAAAPGPGFGRRPQRGGTGPGLRQYRCLARRTALTGTGPAAIGPGTAGKPWSPLAQRFSPSRR